MNWLLFTPEIYYLLVSLLFLGTSMVGRATPGTDYIVALSAAAVGVAVTAAAVKLEGSLFVGSYRIDLFSQVFKVILSSALFLVLCICAQLKGIRERHRRDFYCLLFVCTVAMMMLVSSVHLISIYLSLELSSYSLYVLVALRKNANLGLEAGIKYFIIGIFASAMMFFGMGMVYASTGAGYLEELTEVLPGFVQDPLLMLGLLLTLSGFFFKLAVFPFHFWAPDVYQGSMNQVAAYIATASKVAAIGILLRVIALLGEGNAYLVQVLSALSIVSMTLGNLAAIVEHDVKRLLAYSTIAHAGYVLIGVLSASAGGYSGTVFYAMSLLLMKFTVFLVVVQVASAGGNLRIEQLAGLHRRSPLLAMTLLVAAFSLAGIPPTVGFTGKFLVFTAAMQKGYFTLVLIGMINVVISLYYYLMMVRAAYLLEPDEALPDLHLSLPMRTLTGALVVLMLVAGSFPYPFIQAANAAVRALM